MDFEWAKYALILTASILALGVSIWKHKPRLSAAKPHFPSHSQYSSGDSIAQLIVRQAVSEKHRVYAVDVAQSISYSEFFQNSFFLGRALRRLCGVERNHIAVMMGNCIEYLALYAAAALWDLVICPINMALAVEEKTQILENVDATIVISEDLEAWNYMILRKRDLADIIKSESHSQVDPYDWAIDRWDKWSNCCGEPWMILSTSGTSTGKPKGVVRSQKSMRSGFEFHNKTLGFTSNTTALLSFPLHSISSAFFSFSYMEAGMKVVLQNGIAPEVFHQTFALHEVHFLTCTSSTLMQLVLPKHVTCVGISGTMAQSALLEKFPQIRLVDFYGSTEAGLVLISDDNLDFRPAFPNSVRLVPLPDGQQEIAARTPMMFSSYWKNPILTATSFSDGYFLTGDIADRRGDGISVLGRKDDMMTLPSGQKVFPAELENVLGRCAVLAVPSNCNAQKLICLFDQGEESDFRERARQLGVARRPHEYRKVTRLPCTSTGKVIRVSARELL